MLCIELQAWRVLDFIINIKKEGSTPKPLISESGTITSTSSDTEETLNYEVYVATINWFSLLQFRARFPQNSSP